MAASTVRVGVGCFVTKRENGETYFLIGQRKGSFGDGTWVLPGGHLEMGESWSACAKREVLEECGIELLPDLELEHVATVNSIFAKEIPMKHHVSLCMASKIPNAFKGSVRVMEPDKCSQWVWITWEELVARKATHTRDACRDGESDEAWEKPLTLDPLFVPMENLVAHIGPDNKPSWL